MPSLPKGDVWFVYDGECPICTLGARYSRLHEAVGTIHLVDARKDHNHPVMQEVNAKGFDVDQGMVLKFQDAYYQGTDALHLLALLSTQRDWFNRVNAWLFRSKARAAFCYPFMRAGRNLALRLKGVPQIENLKNT